MNEMELGGIPQDLGQSTQETEYVLRSELAVIMSTLVGHYEKRIAQLETAVQQLVQVIQDQQRQIQQKSFTEHSNILQPNTHIQNQASIHKEPLKQTMGGIGEILSTQNSDSYFFNQLQQNNSQSSLLGEIHTILNQQSQVTIGQTLQPETSNECYENFNYGHNEYQIYLKENQNENIERSVDSYKEMAKKTQQNRPPSVFSKQQNHHKNSVLHQENQNYSNYQSKSQKKGFSQSVQKQQPGGIKNSLKKEVNSDFKERVSLFHMNNCMSPTTLIESNAKNYNHYIQTQNEERLETSPESIIETNESQDPYKRQLISICTQDYHVTEIQSPSILEKYKTNSENQNKHHATGKFESQNTSQMAYEGFEGLPRDSSLTQLVEEEGRNANEQLVKSLQGISGLQSQTHDNRQSTLDAQRMSMGVQKTQQSFQEVVQQRPSSSLSQKMKSQVPLKQKQAKSTTGNKLNKSFNSKTKKPVAARFPYLNGPRNAQEKLRQSDTIPKPVTQRPVPPPSRQQASGQSSRTNGTTSTASKTQQNDNVSIAKLLMPQLTSDRIFQIKNPLALNKVKQVGQVEQKGSCPNQKTNSIDLASKKEEVLEVSNPQVSCIMHHEISQKSLVSQSQQLVSSNGLMSQREPLTVRDLERIESVQSHNGIVVEERLSNLNSVGASKPQTNASLGKKSKSSSAKGSSKKSSSKMSSNSANSQRESIRSQKRKTVDNRLHLFSCNAESRMRNLVQTIERYRIEEQGKSVEGRRKSLNNVEHFDMTHNFNNKDLKEVTQQEEVEDINIDKIQIRNDVAHFKNGSFSMQNTQIQPIELFKQKEHQVTESYGSEIDFQINQQKILMFARNPSDSTLKGIEECCDEPETKVFEQKLETYSNSNQSSATSNKLKSRNQLPGNDDYFSFSQLEERHIEEEESKRLSRNDTIVKLNIAKESEVTFHDLTGDVLDIISEYLGTNSQLFPLYTLSNSYILKKYAHYRCENFQIQNEILGDQIVELRKELYDYFDQKLFKMSQGLQIIYLSNINSKEWACLQEFCLEQQLQKEDQLLLRVYLILLGLKPEQDLQGQISSLIEANKHNLNAVFNPEAHFTFGPQTVTQVGQLLSSFSLENYIINYSHHQQKQIRKIRTLQILAQIIYEALQFCKIVPNRIESDIRELERVISHYSSLQAKINTIAIIKQ